MSFEVIKAGFSTSVQDYGRFSYKKYGLNQSGAIDEVSFCWANRLLNNDFNNAVLEITFVGVVLKAQSDAFVAVTGGDFNFKINNKPADMWQSIKIKKDDILTWDKPKSGMRTYLGVMGGFKTKEFFGSRSVNLRENIGSNLKNGDVLPFTKISPTTLIRQLKTKHIPDYSQDIVLRLLPSYQFNEFTNGQKEAFFKQTYTISKDSNRTGCRLNGKPIMINNNKMISEGLSYGCVEITNAGLPIILLKDAPTIGGYSKIGTIFSLDLAKLAQKPVGSNIRFELISIEKAQNKRLKFNKFFKQNKSPALDMDAL